MGANGSKYLLPHLWREDEPSSYDPIKYHPEFGFANREKRTITATKEEMDSVGLSNELRDHCAHIRIHYNGCINERDFIFFRCRGLWDELTDCYYNERMHDMMEFEREKRLNRRERRIKEKLAKEG